MPTVILLVEDEPLLREMTREDLEDLGLSVICARDADEALSVLDGDAHQVGVLITDIRMPGDIDGWELARRARQSHPNLSIIYISGYSVEQQPVPDSVFLKKPYRFTELENALSRFSIC